MRLLAVVALIISLAVPVAAQSRVEQFTTAWDSDLSAYIHYTYYTFESPSMDDQLDSSPQVLVDIYWTTLRVILLAAAVECWNEESQEWLTWGHAASTRHMASIRTEVPDGVTCSADLLFVNNPDERWWSSAQSGAVRLNVSATPGGWMSVTPGSSTSSLRSLMPDNDLQSKIKALR